MDMQLRESQHSDIPFLREMLYEGMFWRTSPSRPTFEEALALRKLGDSSVAGENAMETQRL